MAVGAALVLSVGAALASGTVSVGSVLYAETPPDAPEYRQADETVLALGGHPEIGRWRITAFRSPEIVDAGEVVQPAGLPCLKLLLSDAAGNPIAGRSSCGMHRANGFNAAALAVVGRSDRPLNVVFGTVPDSAAGVELLADGRPPQRAQVHDGPAGFHGQIWMLVSPDDPALHTATVGWRAADGVGYAHSLDMTLQLRRPGSPIPLAEPTTER